MVDVCVSDRGEVSDGIPLLTVMIGDQSRMRGMFTSVPCEYAKEIGEALVLYSQSNCNLDRIDSV